MANETAPMTTSQFANAIDRGIRKHFVDVYGAVKPKLELVFNVEDQVDYAEVVQSYTGAGAMQAIGEGERYPSGALMEGYSTTFTPVKYGDTVSVTYEMQKWDKAGLADAKNIGSAQAKQVARKQERVAAAVFNNAFSTSYTSLGDSKPLCSTDHTRPDGGTAQSNASASGVTLTESNLETEINAFRIQKDGRGELIATRPRVLLVPPALEKEALIITKSQNRSETADNDINPYNMREYYGGSLKVVVWDYLGSTMGGSDTAWFLLDPEVHGVTWKWAEKPKVGEMDDTTGRLNDTFYWKVMFYASTGWSRWQGVRGSKGDGAAYTD